MFEIFSLQSSLLGWFFKGWPFTLLCSLLLLIHQRILSTVRKKELIHAQWKKARSKNKNTSHSCFLFDSSRRRLFILLVRQQKSTRSKNTTARTHTQHYFKHLSSKSTMFKQANYVALTSR